MKKENTMSTMIRNAAMASSLALMALGGAGTAIAQESDSYRTLNECTDQGNCGDRMPGNAGKHRSQNNQDYDQPGNMQMRKKRSAQYNDRNWKFDSKRHDRQRSRDKKFRFYLGGFYYAQSYWTGESYAIQANRVSCREGRNIVDDSGYSRVRTVECGGGTFTYMGRRNGGTFKVFLNSRTGRIVGRQMV
jgi:hypothetical protein